MTLPNCDECGGTGKLQVPGSVSITCNICHGSGGKHLSECAFRAWGRGYRCSCLDEATDE